MAAQYRISREQANRSDRPRPLRGLPSARGAGTMACVESPNAGTGEPMPNGIRRIVAASDFSLYAHRAARRAGSLARAHEAELHLLHVIDSWSAKNLMLGSSALDVERALEREATRALDSLAEDVAAVGGTVHERSLREGRVTEELLAATASSDLLVVGPRGANPLRDWMLGSTAERLARMIKCPMLVVKQDPQVDYASVLVPVDFSAGSVSALRFAAEIAPSARLHVFHAFDCPAEGMLRRAGLAEDRIEAHCQEMRREADAGMNELTASLEPRVGLGTIQRGDARLLIPQRAAETSSTLIVMGKQGRSWLAEHILGSVTQFVLERAACDVVVVPAA
jgi:nucleotide-binding universal stress UspA family protein